jgi:hypothetical protein
LAPALTGPQSKPLRFVKFIVLDIKKSIAAAFCIMRAPLWTQRKAAGIYATYRLIVRNLEKRQPALA